MIREPIHQWCENEEGVHLVGTASDFTLCGDAMDGDLNEGDFGESSERKRGPVTCPRCIEIIEYCRGVRVRKEPNHA